MIDIKELQRITEEARNKRKEQLKGLCLTEIEDLINKAANDGEYKMILPGDKLNESKRLLLVEVLRDLGYDSKLIDKYKIEVSWDKVDYGRNYSIWLKDNSKVNG